MSNEFESTQVFGNEFAPGQTFAEYQIEKLLGEGAMGSVYKAKSTLSNQDVALKILIPQNRNANENIQRFLNEAQAIAHLNHPNIVKLYKSGQVHTKFFIAMQYVDGQDLKQSIKEKKMGLRKAVALVVKILQAIEYAHNQKTIHRDLKPANIMIDKSGTPYIMDFGLAKTTNASNNLTQTGIIMGTPNYMAPEQIEGKKRNIDKHCDIYSIGVILYELIVGKVPFHASTQWELFNKIATKEALTPSKVNPRTPKSLDKICLKALAKNKKDRYQSAKEFAKELENFLKQQKSEKKQSKIGRFPVGIIVIFFAVIVLASILFVSKKNKVASKKTKVASKKAKVAYSKKKKAASKKSKTLHLKTPKKSVPGKNLQKLAQQNEILNAIKMQWRDLVLNKGYKYFGELENNSAHGYGHMIKPKLKIKYTGEFVSGKRHGYGVYRREKPFVDYMGKWAKNFRDGYGVTFGSTFKYIGKFKNDKRIGKGLYFWGNSTVFAGEFVDKKHGEGVLLDVRWRVAKIGRWENDVYIGKSPIATRWMRWVTSKDVFEGYFPGLRRCVYYGEMKNGKPSGEGICRVLFRKDDIYIYFGPWKNGVPHGHGMIVYVLHGQSARGSGFYIGEVQNFRKQGQGIQILSNQENKLIYTRFKNDKKYGKAISFNIKGYMGRLEYQNDRLNGEGVFARWDKSIYKGQWQDGLVHGKGAFIKLNGEKYIGHWRKNRKHGYGARFFANGRKYIGDWNNDKPHGKGAFFWPGGRHYEGEFANGQPNGYGIEFFDNKVKNKGFWVNGHLKKQ